MIHEYLKFCCMWVRASFSTQLLLIAIVCFHFDPGSLTSYLLNFLFSEAFRLFLRHRFKIHYLKTLKKEREKGKGRYKGKGEMDGRRNMMFLEVYL